jgi:DNA-binding MarR family transcriptional regulator
MPDKQVSDQIFEIIQRFIHLRPKLVVPEHIARFKQQMYSLKLGGATNQEDRAFIFRIFIVLERSAIPPTMGELSTELGIPLSSTTRIVDGLVNASLIERVHDVHDRRVVRVQMTKTGQEIYRATMDFNKQRISRMISKFTPEEQTQLLYLMNKLFDSLVVEAEIEKGVPNETL